MASERDRKKRVEFFQLREESSAINDSITELLRAMQSPFVKQRLNEENTLHFTHGQKWTNRTAPYSREGEFQLHSAEWATPFQELVDGDLTLIVRFVQRMSTELQSQFMKMLYSTIGEACEVTGNTVSAKVARSLPAAFLEMFRKIEFGVGRDGSVSLPEIHIGFEPQKLIAELDAQPPEYQAEIERLKAEKTAAALERERLRKTRFRIPDRC